MSAAWCTYIVAVGCYAGATTINCCMLTLAAYIYLYHRSHSCDCPDFRHALSATRAEAALHAMLLPLLKHCCCKNKAMRGLVSGPT
jgi:hypothetical protein